MLVILMLIAGYFMTGISDDALKATVINLHKLTGLTILALMVLRLGWTLVNPKPLPPQGTLGFMKLVEWGGHFFLMLLSSLCHWLAGLDRWPQATRRTPAA